MTTAFFTDAKIKAIIKDHFDGYKNDYCLLELNILNPLVEELGGIINSPPVTDPLVNITLGVNRSKAYYTIFKFVREMKHSNNRNVSYNVPQLINALNRFGGYFRLTAQPSKDNDLYTVVIHDTLEDPIREYIDDLDKCLNSEYASTTSKSNAEVIKKSMESFIDKYGNTDAPSFVYNNLAVKACRMGLKKDAKKARLVQLALNELNKRMNDSTIQWE